jgi:hypothetical protein
MQNKDEHPAKEIFTFMDVLASISFLLAVGRTESKIEPGLCHS